MVSKKYHKTTAAVVFKSQLYTQLVTLAPVVSSGVSIDMGITLQLDFPQGNTDLSDCWRD